MGEQGITDRGNYYGLFLEAYQAIRAAVAEEVAASSRSFVATATEAGTVARERGEGAHDQQAHRNIIVSYNFSSTFLRY